VKGPAAPQQCQVKQYPGVAGLVLPLVRASTTLLLCPSIKLHQKQWLWQNLQN